MRRAVLIWIVLFGAGVFHGGHAATAAEPRHVLVDERLAERLAVLGHRNWIVVADMAYPAQNAAGVETIYVGGDQLAAVRTALAAIEKSPHVRGRIYLDAELDFVPEADAPGATRYRDDLKRLLPPGSYEQLPHEELIGRLDEAARQFRVVVLKTRMTIPYSSVFIELDCGYWSSEAEQRLRASMQEESGLRP